MREPVTTVALLRSLHRGNVAVLLVLLLSMLPALLTFQSVYRPIALEVVAYACLLLVSVALAVLVLAGRPITGVRRWLLTVLTIAAILAATYAVPDRELLGPAHWSWRIAGWFVVLLFLDRPIWVPLSMLAGQQVLVAGQLALVGRVDRPSLVQWGVLAVVHTGAQVTLVISGQVARRVGEAADLMAGRDAELRTSNLIADQVLADHRERYDDIVGTTVPLLEGLRDGRLRPSDPTIRLRCSIEAARLRRLMAEQDDVVDPLVHELRACVNVAERAGARVNLAVRGVSPPLSQAIRRRLTEPVITALAGARSQARVTVVATPQEVVVSLRMDTQAGSGFDALNVVSVASFDGETGAGRGPDIDLSVVRLEDGIYLTSRWKAS